MEQSIIGRDCPAILNYPHFRLVVLGSFAPVILIMKVLTSQQDLDKPFTGGLGSFKLYVLVAHHIEQHLSNGGRDRPSEVLLTLLYRYGCPNSSKSKKTTTDLLGCQNRNSVIHCGKGVCELVPVFKLEDCVAMFNECYFRLTDRIQLAEERDSSKFSYLSSFIDCRRLREARELWARRAKLSESIDHPISQDNPLRVSMVHQS